MNNGKYNLFGIVRTSRPLSEKYLPDVLRSRAFGSQKDLPNLFVRSEMSRNLCNSSKRTPELSENRPVRH